MLVAGHSQGGAVAHLAAEKRPDLFDGAVLFSPSLVGKMHPRTEKALRSRKWRYVLPFLFPGLKPFRIHPDDVRNLFFGGSIDEGFEESIAARMAQQPAATAALKELERKLGAPKVKTTVVVTENDLVLDSGDQAKWARQHGCKLVTLRGHHMSLILDGARAGKIIQQAAA